jgi:hypothetical protein
MTEADRQRILTVARDTLPDSKIDYSDIPKQTRHVKRTRPDRNLA